MYYPLGGGLGGVSIREEKRKCSGMCAVPSTITPNGLGVFSGTKFAIVVLHSHIAMNSIQDEKSGSGTVGVGSCCSCFAK